MGRGGAVKPFALRVTEVVPETAEAKSFVFDVPPELRQAFAWRPGQHVTVVVEMDGESLRRPYTVSASPHAGEPLRITVKRQRRGRVSGYLHDHVQGGSVLRVMPPFGGFCLDPEPTSHRTLYLFAAGSGITPLYAMLRSVLAAEPYSTVHLLYGNRNAKSMIFRQQLDALLQTHDEHLSVTHVLSSPSWWSATEAWRGRIDADAVRRFIDTFPPYAQDAQYFICGPGSMNVDVRRALMDLDVPPERIHAEFFGAAPPDDDTSVVAVASQLTVQLDGVRHDVAAPEGKTVLQALQQAEVDIPYACQSGLCGACKGRLRRGTVHQRAPLALEKTEIEQGWVLTCQSVATSPQLWLDIEA